jgi:hypothetical protein
MFFLHYIRRNPLLDTILFLFLEEPFPSVYMADYVEPEYFVPPPRWAPEGHRGAIFRQYTSGIHGEELWHIRALSRSLDHESGLSYVGARRQWQDFTHYKGRTVPRNILEAAYNAAGFKDLQWLEGGRNLELGDGESGWRVLREWRITASDESEVDDDFTDAELTGTDMDTDDEEDDDDVSNGGWGIGGHNHLMDQAGIEDDDGWADTDDDGEYDENDDEDDDDPLDMI